MSRVLDSASRKKRLIPHGVLTDSHIGAVIHAKVAKISYIPLYAFGFHMDRSTSSASGDFSIVLVPVSGKFNKENPIKSGLVTRIQNISRDPEMYEEGEVPPDESTRERAKEIIRGVVPSGLLAGADVYAHFGEINIGWSTQRKRVELTVHRNGLAKLPSIYHGRMDKGRVVDSKIESNATAESLSRWLEWLTI